MSEVLIQAANEQIKCRVPYETRCKGTTFPQITRRYAVKVSKKIRFREPDADRTEEFGDFEAIVCNMMMSRSVEGEASLS